MKIPQSVIDSVSSRASLAEVVSGYLSLEQKGGRLWGLCPFHQEKTPSFCVTDDENLFYCFGCNKGGNLFSFVQEMENLSFPEAVQLLADKVGIEIPTDDSPQSSHRTALNELYTRVAGSLHYYLTNKKDAEPARRYLADRGVTNESIEAFQIGYAPPDRSWLHRFLAKQNYSNDFLVSSGLFSRKYPSSSFFSHRIMFPIRIRGGKAIAFGARSLGDKEPKYLNSPETEIFSKRTTLYGMSESVAHIRKEKQFVLTEGYLDVIALHQAGIPTAVAPLGTSFTDEQVSMLHRFTDTAILLFDGDEAGVKAAEKSVSTCEKAGLESEVAEIPEGQDPGDSMRSGEYESLKNVLKNRMKGFTFVLNQTIRTFDVRGAGGKESALRVLLPIIDIAYSEVRKQTFLDETADALRVDPEAVRADYRRFRRGERLEPVVDSKPDEISNDLFLMLAVALNRSMFRHVRAQLATEDLPDTRAKQIYVALEECFRGDEDSMDALMSRISDPGLVQLLIQKSAKEEFAEEGDRIIKDAVISIKEHSLQAKRNLVITSLRRLEQPGTADPSEVRDLLEEKMWIDAELLKLKDTRNE